MRMEVEWEDDNKYFVTFRGTDELAKISNISTVTFVATTNHEEDARSLAWDDLKEEFGDLAKYFEHHWTLSTAKLNEETT